MATQLWRKRLVVTVGGAAVIGMGVLAGCAENKEAPSTTETSTVTTTTTTTTTTAPETTAPETGAPATTPEVSPSEKGGGFVVQPDPFTTQAPVYTQNPNHGNH